MHICRHLDAQPNRKNEYNVGMYRIALLVWLWGVWGLLLAIPTLGIVKVVSQRIEELHLVAELLKNAGVPPNDGVLSAHRWTPYLSIEFLNTLSGPHVPTEFVASGYEDHPFCADIQIAAARLPTPGRINSLTVC
jgi:hypothetical protein